MRLGREVLDPPLQQKEHLELVGACSAGGMLVFSVPHVPCSHSCKWTDLRLQDWFVEAALWVSWRHMGDCRVSGPQTIGTVLCLVHQRSNVSRLSPGELIAIRPFLRW